MNDGNVSGRASGKAIAALALGILSVICMGFVTGIPAIVIGLTELKAIKDGRSSQAGESLTKIGYVLGIIGTVVSVAIFMMGFIFFMLGVSLGAASFLQSFTN